MSTLRYKVLSSICPVQSVQHLSSVFCHMFQLMNTRVFYLSKRAISGQVQKPRFYWSGIVASLHPYGGASFWTDAPLGAAMPQKGSTR
jgi:hypothetical protein